MVVMCAGCDRPILDRFLLNVLDRAWHSGCVQCSDCKDSLSEKCFSRDGKLYCRQDFFRRFGTRCSGCALEISPNELVRRARSRVYHLKCFNCLVCGKQLSTGEELYMVDEHRFICRHDYLAKFQNGEENDLDLEPSTFENTEDAFSDNDVSADEINDDDDAPRDSVSSHVLVNPNCNTARPNNNNNNNNSNGAVVGSNRGLALGPNVVGAPHPVSPRFVGGVQHPQSLGSAGVEPGATSSRSGIVIKQEKLNNADSNCSADSLCSSGGGDTGTGNGPGTGNGTGTGSGPTAGHKDAKDAENNNSKDAAGMENAATGKRRGPRTTIKAKQLETLKAAFAATPKPTRHIREQLAQETGLNMRVIQVWFQNRRSKERRMKQLSVLGVRRQFYRNPRRLRALRPGEDLAEELGQTGFNYFTDNSDFYAGYPGYGDYFAGHHPIPDPEAMNYLPPTSGHQPNQHLLDQVTGQSIHDGPSFLTGDLGLRSTGSPPEPPPTTPMGPLHPHDAHFGSGGAQGLPRHGAMTGLQGPFTGGGRYPEIW